MSTEIQHRTQDQLVEQMEWSKAMAQGDILPRQYRGNPANLMFACEYADALGIPRINALTSIHVIDGKPTASADLIAGLVRKAGHKLRVEGDDTYATAQIIRADDPTYEPTPVRWDEAKARKAGKWGSKGPWTNYPGAMLRSRAITEAARMWASDALFGVIYTAEELSTDPEPRRVESEQVQPSQPSIAPTEQHVSRIPANMTDRIARETEPAKLDQMVAWLGGLSGEDAQTVADLQALCAARVEELIAAPDPEPEADTHDAAQQVLTDVIDAEEVPA